MASAVNCEGLEAALIIQYVIICSRSMLSPGAGAASVWSAAVFNNKKRSILCHFGTSRASAFMLLFSCVNQAV